MSYAAMIISTMLLGFLAGLLSFKVKSRWCARCGAVKRCPTCAGWATTARSQSDARVTAADSPTNRDARPR